MSEQEQETVWSVDGDEFCYESLHCLIDSNIGNFDVGDTVYFGTARKPPLSNFCDASDVIELITDRGNDFGGEYADGFMDDVSDEAERELTKLLEEWMEANVTVNFFRVFDVRKYVLTEEDLLKS